MLRALLDAFWNESVWLPTNTTWVDLAPAPDKKVVYTDHRHLLLTIPMALAFTAVRCIVSQYVFAPFGRSLGIKDGKNKKPTLIPKLEDAYRKNTILKQGMWWYYMINFAFYSFLAISHFWDIRRKDFWPMFVHHLVATTLLHLSWVCNFHRIGTLVLLIHDSADVFLEICALAKQIDMSERQVERWWRLRRSQDKPSTLVKFCENAWRCTFYLYNFSFGVFILWDKDWLWEIDYAYIGYPHQGLTNDVWWYYMISSAFYWSLTMSQFWDVRRKDFWQMFVHHLATIALLSFSWVCNLHRIGTLVLLSHDCADIFLEAAKAMKYAGYQRFCDCVFAVFTLLWIVTRLGIYPFYIIWSTSIRAPMLLPMFPAYYIFNALLCLLLALHMVWTWLILQVAYKTIKAGQMEGDIRSSSSDISDSSHYSNHSTPNRVSNKKDT